MNNLKHQEYNLIQPRMLNRLNYYNMIFKAFLSFVYLCRSRVGFLAFHMYGQFGNFFQHIFVR